MMNSLRAALGRWTRPRCEFPGIEEKLDQLKINQGILLNEMHATKASQNLKDFEYKVFSQWGEDGIIQRLIRLVEPQNRTFVEFGVEDFSESNCRYLLMKDNWSGFVMDGSAANMERLKHSYYYWRYDLQAVSAFITRENINGFIAQSGFGRELGVLSIDVDGNDYWVWESIDSVSPAITIVEYNASFGSDRAVTIPYKADFFRTTAHSSNLYYGASLPALCFLGKRKGYAFVGCNSAGNNAFFIREDLRPRDLPELTAKEGFVRSKFRESRSADGTLAFLSKNEEAEILKQLPVVEVE
ncbi:MAG: hypothetical protein ABR865_16125 [Terracidiphilus sp.]|jgi:hypothetical protein